MRVFRIVTEARIADAFNGEGARLYGGRWNPKGWPLVYAAATRSLALLEMLTQDQPLHARYAFIPAELPAGVRVKHLTHRDLPTGWRAATARSHLQEVGRDWLAGGESLVLSVPSAVLPQEQNFLLNPVHPQFGRIRIATAETLDTDSRLLRRA